MTVEDLDDQLDYDHSLSTDSEQPDQDETEIGNDAEKKAATSNAPLSESDKKARAKAKLKERKRIKNEMDREQKEHLALSEPVVIADYVAKLVTRTNPELSAVELQDRTVPESQIVYTGNVVAERQKLANIGPFFEQFSLNKKPKAGRDLVLVLCISAIRVCDVVRALRPANKGGALKLIKQNKPEYDRRCLRSPAHVAVSTPGRVLKLMELRILDFKRIKKVVVDTSMIDAKQRTIWDIDGTVQLVADLAHKNKADVYLY